MRDCQLQMMSHTKHRSQSVLQGYVDSSMQSKLNVSNASSTKRTIPESGIMLTYDFFMTDTNMYYRCTKQVSESRL